MYLIVGIGNPGENYRETRHNVGFDVIDTLSDKLKINLNKNKFKGLLGEGRYNNKKIFLLKPMTYVNLSGESVLEITNFYKIPFENIIVVYDDISLDTGRIRIRKKGSSGGHNGMKSIIKNLGSDKFPRVKVGIGSPKHGLVPHVLGKFGKEDRILVDKAIKASSHALITLIDEGIEIAMTQYNNFNAI